MGIRDSISGRCVIHIWSENANWIDYLREGPTNLPSFQGCSVTTIRHGITRLRTHIDHLLLLDRCNFIGIRAFRRPQTTYPGPQIEETKTWRLITDTFCTSLVVIRTFACSTQMSGSSPPIRADPSPTVYPVSRRVGRGSFEISSELGCAVQLSNVIRLAYR